jgi:uncharacterized membrane protein YdjX (TVP38/TMEM64 family)
MRITRNRLIVLGAVIVGLMAPAGLLPFTPWFVALFERVSHLRFWGPVALTGSCIVGSMFPLPAVIPILASGFLFGVLQGTIISEIGTTVGACAAFLLARRVARGGSAGGIPLGGRLATLDRAVGEQGFKIVLLSRLSPLAPFISVNYAFGFTRVSFGQYAWGTLIGGAPGTILFVFFGAGLHSLREVITYAEGEGQDTAAQHLFFWASLAVTVVVSVWLTWVAHVALRRALPQEPEEVREQLVRPGRPGRERWLDGKSLPNLFSSGGVLGIIRRWL